MYMTGSKKVYDDAELTLFCKSWNIGQASLRRETAPVAVVY